MAIDFEIIKEYGTITDEKDFAKKVLLISWNDRKPKIDIRSWQPSGKPGKGITFSFEEVSVLKEILNNIDTE